MSVYVELRYNLIRGCLHGGKFSISPAKSLSIWLSSMLFDGLVGTGTRISWNSRDVGTESRKYTGSREQKTKVSQLSYLLHASKAKKPVKSLLIAFYLQFLKAPEACILQSLRLSLFERIHSHLPLDLRSSSPLGLDGPCRICQWDDWGVVPIL